MNGASSARSSAFAGSFDLDSALAVCDADLDELQSLIDKSLVRRWGSGRFGMLETIHEFAAERLNEAGEDGEVGRRHAEHFLAVAQSAKLGSDDDGPGAPETARLELANLRGALQWAVDNHESELGLQLAVALARFWVSEAPFEGDQWFGALLAGAGNLDQGLRADALRDHGGVVYILGQFDRGMALYEESLALYRSLGDELGVAHMLHRLAVDAVRHRRSRARPSANGGGTFDGCRARGAAGGGICVSTLGSIAFEEGNTDQAIELLEQSVEVAAEVGFAWWQGGRLLDLAELAVEAGRSEDAERWLLDGLAVLRPLRDRQLLVYGLAMLAALEAERGNAERAGELWGAVEAEEERGAIGHWESEREQYERIVLAHADSKLEAGREAGRLLSLEDAVSLALSRG